LIEKDSARERETRSEGTAKIRSELKGYWGVGKKNVGEGGSGMADTKIAKGCIKKVESAIQGKFRRAVKGT